MIKHKLTNAVALLGAFFCMTISAGAKVWRVNNNPGVSADFSQIWMAIQSNAVQNDDTLYLEGSVTRYELSAISKRLVFIGAGYLLSGANGNPGLQWNPNPANVSELHLDSLASGSTFIGFSAYLRINSDVDNLTFIRSSIFIDPLTPISNSSANNWTINKCIFGGNFPYRYENISITNSLAVYSGISIANAVNGFIRNNVFSNGLSVTNSYISNNIFLSSFSGLNSTVKYNIATSNVLPAGNNNQVNVSSIDLFTSTGSDDGRYQLKPGSPAIGAGEPINGVTPDAGAFGTADPYRLSGIPPIPTIYSLTVPASVPATATSINITFSTRSNN